MLAFITTEFQKLKRYSIILVGMLGVACSPIISIVMQKIMTDEAKNVLNYTFPDLLNSTIWNNMTMFFPMIIALIGGYMINREYTDDTLKNLQVIPISFPKLMIGKLTTIGLLSILLGLCNSFVTIIVGIIACRENMTLSTIIIGTIQICGMALFTFIGEPIAIAVAFAAVGFQTNNIVRGTKIVTRDIILKIFSFIMVSFLLSFEF